MPAAEAVRVRAFLDHIRGENSMLADHLRNLFRDRGGRRRATRRGLAARLAGLERLDDRVTPAVIASFTPGAGVLTVFGDALNNTIAVSRDAAGKLLVNGGGVTIKGGTATVANTSLIQIFGQDGN